MTADTPTLPKELQDKEDKLAVFTAPIELRTICGFHGPQLGASCAECDKLFPEAVKAREIGAGAPAGVPAGFVSMGDVQKMIKAAIQEERSFQAWKAQEQAAKAAETAQTQSQTGPGTPGTPPPDPTA